MPHNAEVHLIKLGYPGKVDKIPTSLLARSLYAYEVKATLAAHLLEREFKNLTVYDPKIYDVDSINLGISKTERLKLYQRGFNTF